VHIMIIFSLKEKQKILKEIICFIKGNWVIERERIFV